MRFVTDRGEKQAQSFRFQILLLALVANLLVPPYVESLEVLHHAWKACVSLVMLAALYSLTSRGRRVVLWLVLLLIPSFLTNWLQLFIEGRWVVFADDITTILYFTLVAFCLARFIMSTRVVTGNVIYAALCLYMILAIIMAAVYNLHYVYFENSFAFSNDALARLADNPGTTFSLFNYYSFVTLTTLGYGDIVPLTRVTQAWVAVEAMVGQFYIAIIIARLVSSYRHGAAE